MRPIMNYCHCCLRLWIVCVVMLSPLAAQSVLVGYARLQVAALQIDGMIRNLCWYKWKQRSGSIKLARPAVKPGRLSLSQTAGVSFIRRIYAEAL